MSAWEEGTSLSNTKCNLLLRESYIMLHSGVLLLTFQNELTLYIGQEQMLAVIFLCQTPF